MEHKVWLRQELRHIFHRNCANLGLSVISQLEAIAAAKPGAKIRIDTDKGEIEVDGERFASEPIPPFMADMISSRPDHLGPVEARRKGGD